MCRKFPELVLKSSRIISIYLSININIYIYIYICIHLYLDVQVKSLGMYMNSYEHANSIQLMLRIMPVIIILMLRWLLACKQMHANQHMLLLLVKQAITRRINGNINDQQTNTTEMLLLHG